MEVGGIGGPEKDLEGKEHGTGKEDAAVREKKIETVLVQEVKKLGGRAYKWVSPGNDGVPDRIVVFPGKAPVFVELKSETGRLSALQEVQVQRLRDLGQEVAVIYGIDGLSQFFQDRGYEETSKALDCRFEL